MNFKENDIVQFTEEAIAENCRLFGKEALLRKERGKRYKVTKVGEDKHNKIDVVFVTDINGNPIPKFEAGIFAGHLKILKPSFTIISL